MSPSLCDDMEGIVLQFSSQVWSSNYKYFIDKVDCVQHFFSKNVCEDRGLTYLLWEIR